MPLPTVQSLGRNLRLGGRPSVRALEINLWQVPPIHCCVATIIVQSAIDIAGNRAASILGLRVLAASVAERLVDHRNIASGQIAAALVGYRIQLRIIHAT